MSRYILIALIVFGIIIFFALLLAVLLHVFPITVKFSGYGRAAPEERHTKPDWLCGEYSVTLCFFNTVKITTASRRLRRREDARAERGQACGKSRDGDKADTPAGSSGSGKKRRKKRFTKPFLSALTLKHFSVSAKAGAGDSAATALLVGTCYAALAVPQTLINMYTLPPPEKKPATVVLRITPEFEKICFDGEFECIFSLSAGKIILNYVKTLTARKGR